MTFGIGMLALLIQIFWPKVSAKIPGSLIAILVTTLIVQLGKLPVATIGDLYTIKAGFPKFAAPQLSFALVKELIQPAFTIAILASIESLLSCVVSDGMIGGHHRSNAELVGQGVGNIMSSSSAVSRQPERSPEPQPMSKTADVHQSPVSSMRSPYC